VIVEVVSGASVALGAIFCVVGGIGTLRLPDFFSRTHAASVTDTLGAALILLGLAGREGAAWLAGDGSLDIVLKLLLLLAFIYVVSPTATHALAKAAYYGGVRVESPPEPPLEPEAPVDGGPEPPGEPVP